MSNYFYQLFALSASECNKRGNQYHCCTGGLVFLVFEMVMAVGKFFNIGYLDEPILTSLSLCLPVHACVCTHLGFIQVWWWHGLLDMSIESVVPQLVEMERICSLPLVAEFYPAENTAMLYFCRHDIGNLVYCTWSRLIRPSFGNSQTNCSSVLSGLCRGGRYPSHWWSNSHQPLADSRGCGHNRVSAQRVHPVSTKDTHQPQTPYICSFMSFTPYNDLDTFLNLWEWFVS